MWFAIEGVSFMGKSKKLTSMVGTLITEMIPFLGALPGLTLGVYLTISAHEAELKEKEGNSPKSGTSANPAIVRKRRRTISQ